MELVIEKITLKQGSHSKREAGVCAMEAVAWLAGEDHTDHPQCACPAISAAVRRFNDRLPDDAAVAAAVAKKFKRFSKEWYAVYNEAYKKQYAKFSKIFDRRPFWQKTVEMIEAMLAVKA